MTEIVIQRLERFTKFLERRRKKFMVVYGGRHSGKCFIRGTKVIMADGRLKNVEDIAIGDEIMGIDSKPHSVLQTHSGIDRLFRVKQTRGIDYIVNSEHLLALKRSIGAIKDKGELCSRGNFRRPNGRYPGYGDYTTVSVKEYLKQSNRWKANFFGYRMDVEFDEKEVSLDPYLLGLWLGDGDSHRTAFTSMDKEIVEHIYKTAQELKMGVHISGEKDSKAKTYFITNGNCGGPIDSRNPLLNLFKSHNLIKNKHIPEVFLYNSREIRLKLLAGLIDTDGYYSNNCCFSITQKNRTLSEQIHYLSSSLGFFTSITKTKKRIVKRDFVGEYYRIDIYGKLEEIPILIPRKKPDVQGRRQSPEITGLLIEPYGIDRYYGFSIEGDGYFFLSDFTVVHNSYALAQLFIQRLYEEDDIRMLVLRKTLPALKITAYRLIVDLLELYQLPFVQNKTVPMTIKYGNNEILFGSLDNPEKYKSFEGNYLWVEEATELTFDEFLKISLVMSRRNLVYLNQIFLTFNPISCKHWVMVNFVNAERDDIAVMHSTYLDNPFLAQDHVKQLENLIHEDDSLYNIYVLGKCGEIKDRIYKCVIGTYPDQLDRIRYGLDFGFNNPSALLEVGFQGELCYERELLYQSHLTNQELIDRLKMVIEHPKAPIYADPAEPARIAAIKQAGFNIFPANNSVRDGIDFVKTCNPIIDQGSVNLINEKQDYKWQEKAGVVIDAPVKFRDHLMACERYALYSPMGKQSKALFYSVQGKSSGGSGGEVPLKKNKY